MERYAGYSSDQIRRVASEVISLAPPKADTPGLVYKKFTHPGPMGEGSFVFTPPSRSRGPSFPQFNIDSKELFKKLYSGESYRVGGKEINFIPQGRDLLLKVKTSYAGGQQEPKYYRIHNVWPLKGGRIAADSVEGSFTHD